MPPPTTSRVSFRTAIRHRRCVYVMECEGFYKIGYSANPEDRLINVQSQCPFPVRLVGYVSGDVRTEIYWQQLFAEKRVRGEWYKLAPDEVEMILGSTHEE